MFNLFITSMLICLMGLPVFSDVVINEIYYNPPDIEYTIAGSTLEFIELYNPGTVSVNLSGYKFTKGIEYTFPEGTMLNADSYLVIVSDPAQTIWLNKTFSIQGPYTGSLSNSGEKIMLVRRDNTVVEEFKYKDSSPWPQAPDSYGASLERIAWDLPADDYHSWRASKISGGTPGKQNSIVGMLSHPMITATEIEPKYPGSKDAVTVRFGFDAPEIIESVTLQWEKAEQGQDPRKLAEYSILINGTSSFNYFKGIEDPSDGNLWTQPDFDDSKWLKGNGGFGYGDNPVIGTKLTDMRNQYTTVYLRKQFSIHNVAILPDSDLSIYYSGGYICYLNGTEVARANVPASVTNESLALRSHDINTADIITIKNEGNLFREGQNTLSIIGVNNKLNASSFGIRVYLLDGSVKANNEITTTVHEVTMQKMSENPETVTYEAVIPPNRSQKLIRFNALLSLKNSNTLVLPFYTDTKPFESYFVYDGEIKSLLPIIWPYYSGQSGILEKSRQVTGVVIQPSDNIHPMVYDGAELYQSQNGHKIKFLRGAEYHGNRTLVIFPEIDRNVQTLNFSAAFRENLAYWYFQQLGVISPCIEWFRVAVNDKHYQQLLLQQINSTYLEQIGFNPDGDLYKCYYMEWENHNNLETGTKSINALEQTIQKSNQEELHTALTTNLAVEEFIAYSVASVLTGNWDGFHNNNWMYLEPETSKWHIFPWDLDNTWGLAWDTPMFPELPVEFPLNGFAAYVGRPTGLITGPFHRDTIYHQQYIDLLKYEMSHTFTEEFLFKKIQEIESLLKDDLNLQEKYTGATDDEARQRITESYKIIRKFIQLRRAYLNKQLGTAVQDWSLF